MNLNKQQKKLTEYLCKAEDCTSREEAQKILDKYHKAQAKVFVGRLLNNVG